MNAQLSFKDESGAMKNNMVAFLAIGLVLGFVLGHLWTRVNALEGGSVAGIQNQGGQALPEEPRELSIAKPDPDNDHWLGPKDARYVHVEYSDFECPFCKTYAETMSQLKDEYGDQIAFVYRHFPLAFHPLAQPAAEASECVAELGGNDAFWAFHDEVFAQMPDMTEDDFATIASNAGVNQGAFTECFESGKYADKVTDQFNEGSAAGVNATPTNVVYDMETGESALIEGAQPFNVASQVIADFIK